MSAVEHVFSSSDMLLDHLGMMRQKTYTLKNQDINMMSWKIDSGLLFCVIPDGSRYLMRECAKDSVLERLGISGEALNKLSLEDLAQVYNLCKATRNGKAQVVIVDGEIDAILSDNVTRNDFDGNYPASEVFQETQNWIWGSFGPEETFTGQWNHEHTYGKWKLSQTKEFAGDEANICITLSTSDIGKGAVAFRASLKKPGGAEIPLCDPIKIGHRKDSGRFVSLTEALQMLDSTIANVDKNFEHLKSVVIDNPEGCLTRIAKQIGIPKKCFHDALNEFKETLSPTTSYTALDLFNVLVNTSYYYQLKQESMYMQEKLMGNIYKAVGMNWAEYDIPGSFSY